MAALVLALMVFPCACTAGGSEALSTSSLPAATSTPPTVAPAGAVTAPSAAAGLSTVKWSSDDMDSVWSTAGATLVTLEGDSIRVSGSGAEVDGTTVTFMAAGTYVISGGLDDGQLRVDSPQKGAVKLVLNGVDIRCSTGPAVYVLEASKVVLTLADGSDNRVEDGVSYVHDEPETDEPGAAIFSHDDLTINGSGSLVVLANYKHGIQCKDDLKIAAGIISVTAVNDGLKGRDSIGIRDGVISVQAGGDGIQSNNDVEPSKGYVVIQGGTLDIIAGEDGIQAESELSISGGTITVTSGGGSSNSSRDVGMLGNTWGRWGQGSVNVVNDTASAKGLKAGARVVIAGGVVTVDSSDDSVHSNGSVTISGGEIVLMSGDDGVHADATVTIDGGYVRIGRSYEGIEGSVIVVNVGDISIVSSDDGMNVRGGADGSAMMGRPGQNTFSSSGGGTLDINGGYVVVSADGDGMDINGAITMTGGVVIIHGPTVGMEGAIDYDRSFDMRGGLLIAAGSVGMAQAPGTSSSHNSVIVNLTSSVPAGTLFRIETRDGEDVLTFAPMKAYQSLVFSSPDLVVGRSYTVFTGGASTGTRVDGLVTGGTYSAGVQVASFTVEGAVSRVGTAGVGQPGGGGMRPGGVRP